MTEDEINKLINEPFEEAPVEEQPIPEGAGPTSYFRQTFPDDIPEEDLKRQYKEFAENIEGSPDKGTGLTPQSEIDAAARPLYQPATPYVQSIIDTKARQEEIVNKYKLEPTKPREPFAASIGTDETNDELSFGDSVKLAFLVDNPVYAAYERNRANIKDADISLSERNQVLQSFDPTPYIPEDYLKYGDEYVGLVTEKEIDAMTTLIQRREGYRIRMQQAGIMQQVGAGLIGGFADPTIVIPGGVVVKAGKSVSITKSVLSGAVATTAAIGVSEGVLQASDPTRTTSESLISMGAGAVIGAGMTGVAAGRAARNIRLDKADVVARTADIQTRAEAGELMEPEDLMALPQNWDKTKRVVTEESEVKTTRLVEPNNNEEALVLAAARDPHIGDDIIGEVNGKVVRTTPEGQDVNLPEVRGARAQEVYEQAARLHEVNPEVRELVLHATGKTDVDQLTRADIEAIRDSIDDPEMRDILQSVIARTDEAPDDITSIKDTIDDMIANPQKPSDEPQIEGKDYLYGEDEILTGKDFVDQTGHVNQSVNGRAIDEPPETAVARPSVPEEVIETIPPRQPNESSKLMGALSLRKLLTPEKIKGRKSKAGSKVARIPEHRVDDMRNPLIGEILMHLDGSWAYRIYNALGVDSAIGATERLSWWFNRANKVHRASKTEHFPAWAEANGININIKERVVGKHFKVFQHEVGKAQEIMALGGDITDPHIKAAAKAYNDYTTDILGNAISSSNRRSREYGIPQEATEANGWNGIQWRQDQHYLHRTWNLQAVFSDPVKFRKLIIKELTRQEDAHQSGIAKVQRQFGLVDGDDVADALDIERIADDMMNRFEDRSMVTHNTVDSDVSRIGTHMQESKTLRIPFSPELEEFLILDPKVRADFFMRRIGRHKEFKEFLGKFGPHIHNWDDLMDHVNATYRVMARDENIPNRIRNKEKYRKNLIEEEKQARHLLTDIKDEIFQHKKHSRTDIEQGMYNLRKAITMAALGKLVITSAPDIMRTVNEAGWGPAYRAVRAQLDSQFKQMNRVDLEDFGIVVEYLNNKRVNHYIGADDAFDEIQILGGITRGIDKAHKAFFIANLSSMWNQTNKEMAVGAVQHKLINNLKQAPRTSKGMLDVRKMDKRDITDFARYGIAIEDLPELYRMIDTFGSEHPSGMQISNFQNWTNKELQRQYVGMLTRVADNVINTPSARTNPRWLTTNMGALLGQFTSFHYASHAQSMTPMIQDPNWSRISSVMGATAIGYAGYQAKYYLNKGEWDDTDNFLYEGLNASGTLALTFYAIELQDKMAQEWSIDSLMTGKEESDWNHRREATSILGPWASTAATGRDAYLYGTNGEFSKAANRASYITPYANLPYVKLPLDYALDQFDTTTSIEEMGR